MPKIMFNEKSYSSAALNVLNAGLPLDREFTKTYNSITQDSWYDVVNYTDIDPKAIYLYRIEFHDNNFIYNESAYFMLGWPDTTNSANVSTIYANFSGHAPNNRVISLRFNRTGNASSHTEAIQFSITNGAVSNELTAKVYCYRVNGNSLMDLDSKFVSASKQTLTDAQKAQVRDNIGLNDANTFKGNKTFENDVQINGTLISNDLTAKLNEKVSFQKRVSGNMTNSVSIADLPNGVYLVTAQDLYHQARYTGCCILMKHGTTERTVSNFTNNEISFSVSGDTLRCSNSNLYLYHCFFVKLI